MSTVLQTTVSPAAILSASIPILENGDCLSAREFVRRFEATPHLKRAELIEGVVFMAAALRHTQHGDPHARLLTIIGHYAMQTHLDYGDNCTTLLDEQNAPQPDVFVMLPEALGGTSRVNGEGFIEGPPDFVAEVAASSASLDLHGKLRTYQSSGVREYLVWRTLDAAFDWFQLEGREFKPQPIENGIIKSRLFPGLWLDTKALLTKDVSQLYDTFDQGMATGEYRTFAAAIAGLPK